VHHVFLLGVAVGIFMTMNSTITYSISEEEGKRLSAVRNGSC